jgi:hypothetical protein
MLSRLLMALEEDDNDDKLHAEFGVSGAVTRCKVMRDEVRFD